VSELPQFRAGTILRTLVDHGARFVVIGGIAAQAHGSPSLTGDLDICYARDPDNLAAVAASLAELAAIRRDLPAGVPAVPLDAQTLRSGDMFLLQTRAGPLDLLGTPDPNLDYEQLARNAVAFDVEGTRVLIAGLDDLMRMKRAAGRPKDRIELEVLGALREELDRRE